MPAAVHFDDGALWRRPRHRRAGPVLATEMEQILGQNIIVTEIDRRRTGATTWFSDFDTKSGRRALAEFELFFREAFELNGQLLG